MIWFTSDLHFGHLNILTYANRPFSDVPHMNTELVRFWNETVHPDDTVYVLGDFAMGQIADTLPIALRLNGHKKLVRGNHDRCWDGNKKWEQWVGRYEGAGFELMPNQMDFDLGDGISALLCHFPYAGDHTEKDRYIEARPDRAEHDVLIHGHVHDAWLVNGDQINVGADVWSYRPVSIDVIRAMATGLSHKDSGEKQ
jgi:calcineurin-like phosphoesterase family protein